MKTYKEVEAINTLIQERKSCLDWLKAAEKETGYKYVWTTDGFPQWRTMDNAEWPKSFRANVDMIRHIVRERIKQIEAELRVEGIVNG